MTNYNHFDDQFNGDDDPNQKNPEDEIFDDEESQEGEESLEDEVFDSVEESVTKDKGKPAKEFPETLFLVPLTRRPFFPGMAAPIVIEPGIYYEMLKTVANSPNKYMGLVLTKDENANVYKIGYNDLYRVGVVARILRIIPIEQGGAQVVLTMEKRFTIKKPIKSSKWLKAHVSYFDERKKLTKELKAYSISIISTIKELLKLNPLFKEELQIFLGHTDFTEPGKLADFAVALTTAGREELQDVLEAFDLNDRIDKALILLKKESI